MKRRTIAVIAGVLVILVLLVFWSAKSGDWPNSKTHKAKSQTSQATPPPASTPPSFDKNKYSVATPTSIWVVVNKHRPLAPKNYAPDDLTAVGGGQQMRSEAASALTDMFTGAKRAGYVLTAASAYRSYDTQVTVYNKEVKDYGQDIADSESARPGYSEHQTGLAVDIAGGGCSIEDCFGTTAEGKWAAANAYQYGFILRYPADKTAVTGYRTEAWHFRYVGKDLAAEMHKTGVETLEEFFGLGAAPTYN